jgi:hypothetical protein
MTERDECLALIAAAMRKLVELGDATTTIATATRLIADDIDAVEHALILVGNHIRVAAPDRHRFENRDEMS